MIRFLDFQNGCFISLTENEDRLGSISVSINYGLDVKTANVIPSKHDSLFITSLSKRVSSMINGISIISISIADPLKLEDVKAIIEEVMNILKSQIDKRNKP